MKYLEENYESDKIHLRGKSLMQNKKEYSTKV